MVYISSYALYWHILRYYSRLQYHLDVVLFASNGEKLVVDTVSFWSPKGLCLALSKCSPVGKTSGCSGDSLAIQVVKMQHGR